MTEPTRQVFAGLRQAFANSGDDHARVATLYLQLLMVDFTSAEAMKSAESALADLARLAFTSADPQVYGLALQACGVPLLQLSGPAAPAPPACALLNPAQWARLAPDNARAHFGVAARARAAGNAAGELDALQRAAAATSFDDGIGWMDRQLYVALPADVDVDARIGLLQRSLAFRVAFSSSALQSIHQACSTTALADGNRLPMCTALAQGLLRSDSLLDRSFGAKVGERLGLPADLLKAATRPMATSREPWFANAAGFGCLGGARPQRYLEDLLAFGEIDAVRRAAERAGR